MFLTALYFIIGLKIAILLTAGFIITRHYIKHKLRANMFLILVIGISILVEIYNLTIINTIEISGDLESDFFATFNTNIFLSTLAYAVWCLMFFILLLFIQSFESDHMISLRNLILGALIIANFGVFLTIGLILQIYQSEQNIILNFITAQSDNPEVYQTISNEGLLVLTLSFIVTLWYVGAFTAFTLTIITSIFIIRSIKKSKKDTLDKKLKSTLTKLQYMSLAFIPIIFAGDPLITKIIGDLILLVFVITYTRTGVELFQRRHLRNLLLIEKSGLSLYSYDFHSEGEEDDSKNILFSGAFTAIGSLLNEFTGVESNLKEIVLDDWKILIRTLKSDKFLLLISSVSTVAIRQSLTLLSREFDSVFTSFNNAYLENGDIEKLNLLVKQYL
jgi:hypothetical protein